MRHILPYINIHWDKNNGRYPATKYITNTCVIVQLYIKNWTQIKKTGRFQPISELHRTNSFVPSVDIVMAT